MKEGGNPPPTNFIRKEICTIKKSTIKIIKKELVQIAENRFGLEV
jgi:hypothetical protein